MRKLLFFVLAFFSVQLSFSQKKPLDHTVYDGWQSIGERMISNDGRWVVYTVNVQEGDNELVIQSSDAKYKKSIGRGYNAVITEDSRYVIFKIKPFFKDTRDARIKKKKPDDMPKDTFALAELGKDSVLKIAKVRSYKTPEKAPGWVAYHLEKKPEPEKPKTPADTGNKKVIDSLKKTIDSLTLIVNQPPPPPPAKKKKNRDDETIDNGHPDSNREILDNYEEIDESDAEGDEPGTAATTEGTDLVLKNLFSNKEIVFPFVSEYYFNKTGRKLVIETTKNSKDSLSKPSVLVVNLETNRTDTIMKGGNDFKNYAMTDDGSQLAFVAEREAKPKELQKFYKLWFYKETMDTALMLADKNSIGMKLGMTISEFGNISFSKNGKRLFFGTAPIQPPKDTTLVDFETAKLDIWHYKDDYLQTQQLVQLNTELRRSYLAVYDLKNNFIKQLGSSEIPQVLQTNEGDGDTFVGVTDVGKRIESQWMGTTKKDIYAINVNDGSKKLVKQNLVGQLYPSTTGKYIMWYDRQAKNYFVWDGETTRNITAKIKVPLFDEDFDTPDYPTPYGLMGWAKNDTSVFVYDRYDIWEADPLGKKAPINFLNKQSGRKNKTVTRYVDTDPEERFINTRNMLFERFSELSKEKTFVPFSQGFYFYENMQKFSFGAVVKAKATNSFIYTKGNFQQSPDLYIVRDTIPKFDFPGKADIAYSLGDYKLSALNPQQKNYNWGTAELVNWKTTAGKRSEGLLFKPENFDPNKKYPMILYFYEKLSDNLYNYSEPGTSINLSFYVSNGYIVFFPNISYGTGHPGKDALDYVVSGTKYLISKYKWINADRIGLQGHSWGGYQISYIITKTNMFKAAWAGAPVVNMTSAYGGIRYGSGLNRQFQYEKTQSRIGKNLWEALPQYLESSPLFSLNKVNTPVVILHNDNDDAVPYTQGIEMFTALRRLNKKVWMLTYNGEPHGVRQRMNRKDMAIRFEQFFGWQLKDEKPAKWLSEGVPAVKKGKDWGLEVE
jgi:dipeptidyl aminopeptidase/acylaminoacyl peptidase